MRRNRPKVRERGSDKSKYKRLVMPVFAGENSESWVYRAEHYFEIHELSEKEKVKVAVVSFAPNEVDWLRWSHYWKPIVSREALKRRMFDHLRPTSKGSFGARLIRIKQEGTYVDYVKKKFQLLRSSSRHGGERVEGCIHEWFRTVNPDGGHQSASDWVKGLYEGCPMGERS